MGPIIIVIHHSNDLPLLILIPSVPFPLLRPPQVNSPYLEDHLKRMNKQDQSKVRNMDLLWRYYEKSRNFGKAAHVLAHLAEMRR